MAVLNVADQILTTFVGEWFGQKIMSTFWWDVAGAPGVLVEQATFFAAFDTALAAPLKHVPSYLDVCPVQYQMKQRWHQVVAPTRYIKYVYTTPASGLGEAPSYTANLAGVITRTTDIAGRKQVGSLHLPVGSGENGVDDGLIGGTTLSFMYALADVLKLTYSVSGYTIRPVVGPGPSPSGDVRYLTRTIVQETARVMRRRTVGLGI